MQTVIGVFRCATTAQVIFEKLQGRLGEYCTVLVLSNPRKNSLRITGARQPHRVLLETLLVPARSQDSQKTLANLAVAANFPLGDAHLLRKATRLGHHLVLAMPSSLAQGRFARELMSGPGTELLDALRGRWWAEVRGLFGFGRERKDQDADEAFFRCGFRAALSPRLPDGIRSDSALAAEFPEASRSRAFRRGFRRGMRWRQRELRREAAASEREIEAAARA